MTSLPAFAPVTRTGATSCEGSTGWVVPGPTSYTFPKDRLVGARPDVDGHGRRAGDPQVAAERRRVELRVLSREVKGHSEPERGQLGQAAGAAESGEGGDRGRTRARGVLEGLLASAVAQRDGVLAALQAGVDVPLAPRSCAAPSVESMPPVRVMRKAGPVSAFLSSFR